MPQSFFLQPTVIGGLLLLLCPLGSSALTIDFEGLADGEAVSTQYQAVSPGLGVTFSNATALISGAYGGSLNEIDFPPNPDPASPTDITVIGNDPRVGPITMVFNALVASLSAEFIYSDGGTGSLLTIRAFSSSDPLTATQADEVAVATLSEILGTGTIKSLTGSAPIRSVLIEGAAGSNFTMDDLTFTAASPGIPEPATATLLLGGLAALSARRRKPGWPV